MASTLGTAAKLPMLAALGTAATYAAVHTADPGATGANEMTGGSYARKAVTWDTISAGAMALKATFPVFDVVAGGTVAYIGLWTASTNGTYLGTWDVTDEVFSSAGTYTVSSGSVTL